jgi:hypothetical protein
MIEAIYVFVLYVTLHLSSGSLTVPISFDTPDKCERARNAVTNKLDGSLVSIGHSVTACQRQALADVRVTILPLAPMVIP